MKMVVRKFLLVQALLLLAAIFVCIFSMLAAAAWAPDLGTLVFIIWAISPYVAFFAASRILSRVLPFSNLAIPSTVIAAMMLAFTFFAYIGTIGDPSSTDALIFVFVPLYLYIGSFFLLSVALGVSLFIKSNRGPG